MSSACDSSSKDFILVICLIWAQYWSKTRFFSAANSYQVDMDELLRINQISTGQLYEMLAFLSILILNAFNAENANISHD